MVTIFYQVGTEGTGHYTISDTGVNEWTLGGEAYYTDGDGNLWGLQVWSCIALAAGWITVSTTCPGDAPQQFTEVTEYGASYDYLPVPMHFLAGASGSGTTGIPSLDLTVAAPQLVMSVAAVMPAGTTFSFTGATPFSNRFTGFNGGYLWGVVGESESFEYTGPPPPVILPPVRMKRLPLTVDLASCTYDQQNRLLQYEIYRALGPDPDKVGITSDAWKLPYTIVLSAWGEAVDDVWNILKGEAGQPICGRRITIDPSVSPEWAGDYEIMEMQTFAFQGDSSSISGGGTPRSSATAVQPPSGDSGTLKLTLRSYNEDVFVEVSDDPTYATVAGADLSTGGW